MFTREMLWPVSSNIKLKAARHLLGNRSFATGDPFFHKTNYISNSKQVFIILRPLDGITRKRIVLLTFATPSFVIGNYNYETIFFVLIL